MIRTVALDFDGVLHSYHRGYHDGTIYGELISGADEAIRKLQENFSVFVFTSRDVTSVADWLNPRGIPAIPDLENRLDRWSNQTVLLVTNRKLIASVYVDDRAVRFEYWDKTFAEIVSRMG